MRRKTVAFYRYRARMLHGVGVRCQKGVLQTGGPLGPLEPFSGKASLWHMGALTVGLFHPAMSRAAANYTER